MNAKLKAALMWASGLFGNNWKSRILIFAFIAILIAFAARMALAADDPYPRVHLSAGASFGCLSGGPVLGLDAEKEWAQDFSWDVGTTLWGSTKDVRNNWDWHARLIFSRGQFGAGIGPAYLENLDSVNGAHVEYSLMLYWRPIPRVGGAVIHLSDGGTSPVNCGRNAVLLDTVLR